MSTLVPSRPEVHASARPNGRSRLAPSWHLPLLLLFWLATFATSLANPPLLDDADATHAQAAQAMLHSGDWVTLHVDGVRYLEKAPLPYWLAALSLKIFGESAFAVHLPLALAVFGLAALGYRWAARSFDPQSAFYTALFLLTSVGPFLFTRIFIPEALLSLLLACGLYTFHRAMELRPTQSGGALRAASHSTAYGPARTSGAPHAHFFWLCMALAVLTKGLVAIVFLLGTAAVYFTLTRSWRHWRALHPVSGALLFLAVAAPWHILAGVRNTRGANHHGFFWFYFVNEHVLRFLGRRIPRDYNKLPGYLYWALQIVWLFPWSFLVPVAALPLWRQLRQQTAPSRRHSKLLRPLPIQLGPMLLVLLCVLFHGGFTTAIFLYFTALGGVLVVVRRHADGLSWTPFDDLNASRSTQLLLCIFSALVLSFFSLSTNQEYYTFPVYLPLLMLLAVSLARAETGRFEPAITSALEWSHIVLTSTCAGLAAVLLYGLWSARHIPGSTGIGELLAHRGVGDYTLSMSHLFDLTGPSFAALRLPAALAAFVFAVGPLCAWLLRRSERHTASTLTLACTSGVFLFAAHIALVRFAPLLSSRPFAQRMEDLQQSGQIATGSEVLLLGDQAFGSSIPFYLRQPIRLVDGRSTSMLFGSTFPDTPPVFVSSSDLVASWGSGPRKLLFVPAEQHGAATRLLGKRSIVLLQSSGKELLTDRPLDSPAR